MEEPKMILVRALKDWDLRDDENEKTIRLREGKEAEIPLRFFARLVKLGMVVPGGLHYGPAVRMLS